MISTHSSLRLVALVGSVALAIALMGAVAIAPAQAALTQTQIQSIVGLLQSFGADAATIANVTAALNGQATPGSGGSTGGTGGACPALSRDLQQGSTGSDVMALQVFLNGSADTMVASSGAGSPGNETTTFGPATKAAVMKFQTKHSITPVAGYVGPKTRAVIAANCGGTSGTPGTIPTTGGAISVGAGAQPVNSLAPEGASRVPFTTFTVSNNSAQAVAINSVTVQRTGLGLDNNFSGIVLLDSNGLQIGTAKTLNSNHQANLDGFTLNAGQSMTLTVAGNIADNSNANSGQIVSIQVVAINTGATVSGSLPITGASQTINTTLSLGSVSTSTSAFDPGTTQARNIGDTGVRYAGVKFTAGSAEDLKLYSIRWRQVGSVSASDLANVVTVANGTTYPTTLDSTGRYYTTIFPGGLMIAKGNSIDVYVQGDIVGANASGRTVEFDIDKVTDVYFIGQTYGYGVAPSGTWTPWYDGFSASVSGGTLTTVSKANSGKAAAQNIAINVQNQPLGGFTTNFSGEAVSVQQLVFTIATTSTTGLLTNVSLVDENGTAVAGPVDATWVSGTQTVTFTDTVTFPVGVKTYYLQGKVPSGASANAGITASTNLANWTGVTGQTTGNSVSISGSVTMNTMTVKAGALTISLDTQPASQNIVAGVSQFVFANVLLDAQNSGEDLRTSGIKLDFTSSAASNVTGCQVWDGTTALNTGSRVVNSLTSATEITFSFDNVLRIPKGTVKKLGVACNLSSNAATDSTYRFRTDDGLGTDDFTITGDTSGSNITPTLVASTGGTMTVKTASLALTVDSSSPASTTVSGGSTGQTLAVFNARASNDNITLNKIGMSLGGSAASADLMTVYLYHGSTLVGTAVFGAGQTSATSTLTNPLVLNADTDYKITVKADVADVGTGKAGTNGNHIAINPNSAEGISSSGTVQATGTGSATAMRLYNSYPVFTFDTASGNLVAGENVLLTLTVTADSAGDIGLRELNFAFATSTGLTLTAVKLSGPNGIVHSSASLTPDMANGSTSVQVLFNSTSNTNDATVGAGTSKTYTLRGTVGSLTTNSDTISTTLMADTAANSSMVAAGSVTGTTNIIWSPLSTTTLNANNADWTNGYALTKGCFASVGLANNCNARFLTD